MNILVLGGHGFVGTNVVETFQDSNYRIFIRSRRDNLDMTDYLSTISHFKEIKPDVIINCAAKVGSLNYVTQEAAEVVDINMRMLLNIYKGVMEISPKAVVINPVANCAFPGNLQIYTEESFWNGEIHQTVLSYGSTRRMMVVLSDCYRMQYGLRSVNFFVPNMYGPYDSTDPNKAHALNALISKVVKMKKEKQKEMEVWGRGVAIREWLYAKDFAKVVFETVRRIDEDNFKNPLNIAQQFGLSVRELLGIIIEQAGFTGKIKWNHNMPDGAPCKVMDNKKFKKVFPAFEFTDLVKGIKETVKYYESIYPY